MPVRSEVQSFVRPVAINIKRKRMSEQLKECMLYDVFLLLCGVFYGIVLLNGSISSVQAINNGL